MTATVTLTIRVSPELAKRIAALAAEAGISQNKLCNLALDAYSTWMQK